MTTDGFVESILDEYEKTLGRKLKSAERGVAKEYIISDVSRDSLIGAVTRKLAALILYRSLQRLTDEKDDDWGEARSFNDIYDCRVCANAVAQVSVKGILLPISNNEFGMTGILPDAELLSAAQRLFDPQRRVTKPKGFENAGNC